MLTMAACLDKRFRKRQAQTACASCDDKDTIV